MSISSQVHGAWDSVAKETDDPFCPPRISGAYATVWESPTVDTKRMLRNEMLGDGKPEEGNA